MQRAKRWAAVAALGGGLAAPGLAQDLYIYPERNQTPEQQRKDEYDCQGWAKGQTGFDPTRVPTATSSPPQQTGPGVVGQAARGAAVGVVAGKITGVGGGKGAGAGAAAGGMIGGMRRMDQARAEQQWASNEAYQYQQRRNQYDRAYAACLQGRGYTVR